MAPQDEPNPTNLSRWPRFGSRRSRVWLVATLAALAFVALIAAFDGIWLRPLIQHHVHERSGRRIDFDALQIGLDRALQPTVTLRNLVVQNASWADPRPLVRAAELGFTLSWASLRGGNVVLTRLALVDAEIDLERQADGLRNWRLTRPDDRGPGRVRVMWIDARDTRVRLVHRGLALELELQTTPLEAPMVLPEHPGLPLTKRLALHGTRSGTAFEAQLAISDAPTLFDTGQPFALRGELRAGSSRIQAEGTLADLMQLARLDVDLHLTGSRVADLGRVLGLRVPALAGVTEARAHLSKAGERWQLSALQAKVGRSDLAGELQFDGKPPGEGRLVLRAALTSERLNLADWRVAASPASAAPSPASAAPSASRADPNAANPLEADIDLKIAAVDGLALGTVTRVSAHAALRDGRWAVDPAVFTVAGGRASGTLVAETAAAPAAYTLDMRLQGLQLDQLARFPAPLQKLAGALDARIAMRAQGDSFAGLAGSATGSLQATLLRATIPVALDAKLGLDGGRLLGAKLGANDARTPITCSALDLRFDRGRGTARRLAVETPQVALAGTGWIDLGRGSLDLLFTPRRKQTALFALDRAMRVSGALRAPTTAMVAPDGARVGEPCVAGSMP